MCRFNFHLICIKCSLSFNQALEKVRTLEAENQSIEQVGFVFYTNSVQEDCFRLLSDLTSCCCLCLQVKEQMLLLEAQLEKQTDNQVFSEEMEQVYN